MLDNGVTTYTETSHSTELKKLLIHRTWSRSLYLSLKNGDGRNYGILNISNLNILKQLHDENKFYGLTTSLIQ